KKIMKDELKIKLDHNITDKPELRDNVHVFLDREHAGIILSEMLTYYKETDTIIFGIPAGGVPVAAPISRGLELPLDLAVVSKITLPWSTEAGYGAVAFDGTVQLNQKIISRTGLTPDDIKDGIERATIKVDKRFKEFRADKQFPNLEDHTAILVDDGIASGYTMLVAVKALKNKGANKIIIAVPTAHLQALEKVAPHVNEVYCANIRGGPIFAVAEAYKRWYDVEDEEVKEILEEFM
ncbi:MAG: phosphoribosyltransferase, partial [Methanobacterium sp.]